MSPICGPHNGSSTARPARRKTQIRGTDEERKVLHVSIPDWDIIIEEGIPKLTRSFKFDNFKNAMEFSNLVGEKAEEEGHHPRIITEWGSVTIFWWTHKIRNLHRNDFIMASKVDSFYK